MTTETVDLTDVSDALLIEEIRERGLVDEFADDFDLSNYSDSELQAELGERGVGVIDPDFAEPEHDPRLEQIWLHYRGKEVPQCLADYLWDTIGKAV